MKSNCLNLEMDPNISLYRYKLLHFMCMLLNMLLFKNATVAD